MSGLPTHAELVARAARWLRNTQGCSVVFTEYAAADSEIPDAIGWQYRRSILVECKVSRADFIADRQKPFRRLPELGMGSERYFLCPPEVLKVSDVELTRWGLLWARDRHVKVIRKSDGFSARARSQEIAFLVAMLRRASERIPPGTTLDAWLKWDQRPKPAPRKQLTPAEMKRNMAWLLKEAAL